MRIFLLSKGCDEAHQINFSTPSLHLVHHRELTTNTSLLARPCRFETTKVFERARGVPMKDHFHTIPEHPRPHNTNLQGWQKTRGTVPDPARPLGLIADLQNHGEMDECAIQLWTDFLNRQMHGNRTITILAIGQTSKLDMGFVVYPFFAHLDLHHRET